MQSRTSVARKGGAGWQPSPFKPLSLAELLCCGAPDFLAANGDEGSVGRWRQLHLRDTAELFAEAARANIFALDAGALLAALHAQARTWPLVVFEHGRAAAQQALFRHGIHG